MTARDLPAPVWVAGGLVVAVAAWAMLRPSRPGDTGNLAVDVSRDIAGAVSGLLSGVVGGVVQGGAAVVGVPTTGAGPCCEAIDGYDKAGTTWERIKAAFDVSFRCPAVDYLKWAAGKGRPSHCAPRGVVTWEMYGGGVLDDGPPSLYADPFSAIGEVIH